MKDRIPKYPGRVKLTPVAGKTDVFDMVRADEPEEAGSPLNKKTLLTDEAAMEVGLKVEDDPTPSDAFEMLGKKIRKSEWKTGDVIETVRTDLGKNWVLCNGAAVPVGEYPDLRETLPYNTEWRPMATFADFGTSGSNKYNSIRPLPVAGQWFFHYPFSRYNAISSGQKAAVYDAVTDTLIEFDRPSVPGAVNTCGIFGMTHDGDKYILGVYEVNSSQAADDKVHLLTSTDLEDWTLAYSATMGSTAQSIYSLEIYESKDMSFDGENILVYSERSYTTSGSTVFNKKVFAVDKAMTKHTQIRSTSNGDYDQWSLVLAPSGYWAYKPSDDETVYVFGAGSGTALFSFSTTWHLGRVAFFSNRYWIGLPVDGEVSSHIQAADLETNKTATLAVSGIAGDQYACLCGAEYNRNTNEWTLYLKSTVQGKCWAARISADANPTVAENHKVERIKALPENLSCEQMKPDRSQIVNAENTNRALRDPNIKNLPNHHGDTRKYIYASGVTGSGGGTGGGTEDDDDMEDIFIVTDDGNGSVSITASGGTYITDDGNGNVAITAPAGVSITDDNNGNVTIG